MKRKLPARADSYNRLEHLKNRMGHVELNTPTAKEWTEQWAHNHDIDPRIMSFVMFRPEMLYSHLDNRKSDAFPSPRSWAILSRFTKDILSADTELLELVSSVRVGDSAGSEFASFIRLREKIDCENVLEHPEKIERLTLDLKLAFASWAVENAERKGYRLKVLRTIKHFEQSDLAMLMMSMLKARLGEKIFRNVLDDKEFEFLFDYYKIMRGDAEIEVKYGETSNSTDSTGTP